MLYLIYLAAVILGIAIHLGLAKKPLSRGRVVEVALLYLFVFYVGVGGLMGALGHTLRAKEIATGIGWQPGSPFQLEVGMANLAFGVLGVLCIWQRGGFWTATGIGFAVFLLGCAYGHVRELVVHENYAPYNAGAGIFFNDAVLPVIILALLWVRGRCASKGQDS